jgi:hypothetical protein
MTFEDALNELVEQGAVRTRRMSAVWYIAYRWRGGSVEARGLHDISGEWRLGEHMPSAAPSPVGTGWFQVGVMPVNAAPIENETAKNNEGYYLGLTRQCYTCKKERPISWFDQNDGEEGLYRSWECKECSGQRHKERNVDILNEDEHIGDYMKERSKTSRPPVPSEI